MKYKKAVNAFIPYIKNFKGHVEHSMKQYTLRLSVMDLSTYIDLDRAYTVRGYKPFETVAPKFFKVRQQITGFS